MNIGNEKYSHEEIQQIIRGYNYLEHNGTFSELLKKISTCNKCITTYPKRSDHPMGAGRVMISRALLKMEIMLPVL